MLAGVSVSWYTWLEQGRAINASVDVLESLARTLRLDEIERSHLLSLAGHAPRPRSSSGRREVPPGIALLLRSLDPCPAYVLDPMWNVLAWNRSQQRLFPRFASIPVEQRNLVWIMFCDDDARALIGDWDAEARRVLSQFRAETTALRDEPEFVDFVERLVASSDDFARWWPAHDVGGFVERERTFHHPQAGDLRFVTEQLVPVGDPDLRLIVHLGIDGDSSIARLA